MSDASKPRVLVAEDVRSIALTISRSLESVGVEVEVVGDGEACLDRLRQRLPDLLILDLMMPKMHGIDVLKNVRADSRMESLPVIVCTSKEFATEIRKVHELGVIDTVFKPFDCKAFIGTVLGHLDRLRSPDSESIARPDWGIAATEPAASAKPVYLPQIDSTRPSFTLWGTRGSIPVPGARYVRHGGNTSCVSIDLGNDLVIFDAGTGIRELGNAIAGITKHIHLFITHTHWDHIQGFPFFTPAYSSDSRITVHGERGFGKDLEAVLCGQLDSDHFPVQFEDMHADIRFEYLSDDPIVIDGAVVTREYVNHPGATVGYRLEIGGKSLVYIPDNEFLTGYLGAPGNLGPDDPEIVPYQKTLDFATGADILLTEGQYTNEEYASKIGWGHSCLSNACVFVKLVAPREWIVVHHDPIHDDEFLDAKLRLTRDTLASIDCDVRVNHGYDGMVLTLKMALG